MRQSLALLVALGWGAVAHATPNVLVNGSFENGLSGWSTTTAAGPYGSGPALAGPLLQTTPGSTPYGQSVPRDTAASPSAEAAGTAVVYFVDDNAIERLSQTVNLVAGTRYAAGFDYDQLYTGNPYPFTLTASLGGVTLATISSGTAPSDSWLNVSQQFTAPTTGAYSFAIQYNSGAYPAGDVVVDRAFVQNIPEPAALSLLASGLIGAALLHRRGRR